MLIDHNMYQIPTSSKKSRETKNETALTRGAKQAIVTHKTVKFSRIMKRTTHFPQYQDETIGGTNIR